MSLTNNIYLSMFPGSVLSGISVYFILSYLFVPNTFTIPAAIIVSILVYGLARSFIRDNGISDRWQNKVKNELGKNTINVKANLPLSVSNFILVIIYVITLIITGFFSNTNQDLFVPWNQITATQIILLTSSILLCFFVPGYAIVKILDNKQHELKPALKVVLAYIFSVAIVGFVGYVAASFEVPLSEIKPELIAIYVAILIVFIATNSIRTSQSGSRAYFECVKMSIIKNSTEYLVFGTLFALVVLSTYSLYQGVIIGDQWFHNGRSLSLIGGAYKSEAVDSFYPSFFHAVLGTFFSLSGVPSVNAYVSINFLNIMPVLAFYYFFNKWVPESNPNWKKAALLACTFFMLSSGFGWIDVLTIGTTTKPINSQLSALEVFHLVETKTLDIRKAGDFVITGSPAPTTGLILIALPAGFALLGLIREKLNSKAKYLAILALISTVGILCHDEFYLFVIICPFVPLIFRLSESKNSLYLALLSSFFIVFLIDIISPEKYYTARQDFPAPLIVLSALFVGFMWALYVSGIFHRISLAIKLKSKVPNFSRLKIYLGIGIVGAFAYLYLFTFLVWGQLSAGEVQIQEYPSYLPWYLYLMKLGITGLLGFAFLISSLFKRYEREVYILGLIAVIALVLGPYYDEYRFSKYLMVAMGGFASLLIYITISAIKRTRLKPLITGLIIGLVISSSSLSVLMFMGYTASALQYPGFEEFHQHSKRRIFPSPQEIHFFNTLRKDTNLKTDYVTVPAEYRGLDSKLGGFENQTLSKEIEAFVGTSVASPPKFLRSPFTLNATSLTGFYYLLNFTNTHYIILPKENIRNDKLQQPVQFALDNFPKAYEDSNYVVLTVPSITPPTSQKDVAVIKQQEGTFLSSLVSDKKLLRPNNNSKTLVALEFENTSNKQDYILRIFNDDKRSTLWSDPLQQKEVNYIEGKFRTVGENDSTIGSSGIVWQNGVGEYHVSLNHNGLQLSEKDSKFNKEVLLSENEDVKKERSKWYTLKVLTLGNTIAIYLDDLLKLQVQTASSHNLDITKVGIRVDQNTAEFEPIKLGHIPQSNMSYNKGIYSHFYYPINELALSKAAYNTFIDGDKSAFSHKTIMLPWDPSYNDTNFKDYLHFVNDGGRLVVINAGNSFVGGFGKLLNLTAGNTTEFDRIEGSSNWPSNAVAVSGSARTFDLKNSNSNATAISYYMHNGKKVAPFALESKFGSAGGQIIFVNSNGYYDAVFKSPERFFMTLGRIPSILGLNVANYTKEVLPDNVTTGARFVGDLRIAGHTFITTPSLLLPNPNAYTVGDISTSNNSIPVDGIDKKNNLNKNVLIENLTFSGPYRATIESTGFASLPSSVSQYDYIGISLPKRIDLTLKLLDKSGKAEFIITGSNATGKYRVPVSIGNMAEIRFHNIGLQDLFTNTQTVTMKSPEINATGNITVNNLYIPRVDERDMNLKGLNASLHHSDNYITNYRNASRIQYVTYLDWIQFKGTSEDKQIAIKLPGDISERAKIKGIKVPWQEVMVSKNGIILLLSVVSVTTIALWRLGRLRPIMN